MTEPITVDVPHKLGLAEARRRVEGGIGKVAGWIPGGAMTDHRWDGDVLHFTVTAMGHPSLSRRKPRSRAAELRRPARNRI
jgi:hypothetical protein